MSRIRIERSVIAGIDVGQVNDWTALVVVEVLRPVANLDGLHFALVDQVKAEAAAIPTLIDVKHADRIPLGTMYPDQVAMVQQRLRDPRLGEVKSFLDMTGCGRPVFDMFKQARLPNLQGVMITGAHGEATKQPYGWNVGKSELMTRTQVEFQTKHLRISRRLKYAPLLVRELKEFQAVINKSGNTIFNAREGQHDDLVLALALAVFGAVRPRPVHSFEMRFAS